MIRAVRIVGGGGGGRKGGRITECDGWCGQACAALMPAMELVHPQEKHIIHRLLLLASYNSDTIMRKYYCVIQNTK